jgi:hypothetical protein
MKNIMTIEKIQAFTHYPVLSSSLQCLLMFSSDKFVPSDFLIQ